MNKWEIDESKQLRNRGECVNMILMWVMSMRKWWVNEVQYTSVKMMNKWSVIHKRENNE
jgi:hypothetical protein